MSEPFLPEEDGRVGGGREFEQAEFGDAGPEGASNSAGPTAEGAGEEWGAEPPEPFDDRDEWFAAEELAGEGEGLAESETGLPVPQAFDTEGSTAASQARIAGEPPPKWNDSMPGRTARGGAGFLPKAVGWDGLMKGRKLVKPDEVRLPFSPHERLLILDTWQRSGLPAGDFAPLLGISKHTLYLWKKRFTQQGPAGLSDQPRGNPGGSKLSEVTKRTILMLKRLHPEWGCQRISDELLRGPALSAGAAAIARVLHEAGYQLEERRTQPHPDKVRSFERAKPNQLWQTDLFTFVLKRQNRRLFLVAFMDDHSRFLVGYGLHASASTALVLEVVRSAIASYGAPEEILTDNGPQYVTWRGKSQFTRTLEQQGIRQIVSRPKHPQTLGKIERFWGTLWRECLQQAVFLDLEDARRRVGWFIDYYNFQRPHQGLDGLTPADRFFSAAPTVLQTLKERVAANALELSRHGPPRPPFYVTGQVAGQPFSVHAEGERVILTRPGQPRQEVELVAPAAEAAEPVGPAAPLCPHAAPEGVVREVAPPNPGVSWYDTAPVAGSPVAEPPADRAASAAACPEVANE